MTTTDERREKAEAVRRQALRREEEKVKERLRRRGIISLGETDLEAILDLPEGYRVMAVWADEARMSVNIGVTSQDLDIVPDGVEAPILNGRLDEENSFHLQKMWKRWRWSRI